LRGPDDLVVADTGEGQIVDRPAAACLQDLTGLVRPASGGCVLPPEVAARWAAPLGVLCEQRGEQLGIAPIHRLGCGAKLVEHIRSMAQVDESSVSVRRAAQGRGCVKRIYTQRMLERATTRALPMLNRAAEIAPATQACCGACRTCVTTNIFGVLAFATAALVSPLARFARRIASPS
jgi:hypothetical protein